MAANLPPAFPPELQRYVTEVRTYFPELPRLLDEGHGGKYVVVKADQLFGVWDTQRDAVQAGRDHFPDGGFLAQEIDQRLLDVLGKQFVSIVGSVTLAY
jgi:hypothetical protein